MIQVHRLRGESLHLNPDLVESVESTPDTVVTLVDGRRLVVRETPEELVDRLLHFRASILVAADELRSRPSPTLRVISGTGDVEGE